MENQGIHKALGPAKRLYHGQYFLLSLVKLATLLLGINALIRLIAAAFSFNSLLWIALNLVTAALAAGYFYINRPQGLQFARWLDRQLKSQERLQTLFELAEKPPGRSLAFGGIAGQKKNDPADTGGTLYRAQAGPKMRALILEETGHYLAAHPPAVRLDRSLFKGWLPGLFAALILGALVFGIAPTLAQWISAGQELKAVQQKANENISELEELLSAEPLLEELLAELALIKEKLTASKNKEEINLSLQEIRELLSEYAEALAEAGEASMFPEKLLSGGSAAEIAAQLEEYPRLNQQQLDSLQSLQNRLFLVSSAGALSLKDELARIDAPPAAEKSLTAAELQKLQEFLEELDLTAAEEALQSGLKHLASAPGTGTGSAESGPGDPPGGTASGQPEGQSGQGAGQGPGKGSPIGDSENAGGSGSNGSGTSTTGEGNLQQGGNGTGSGGGQGSGAGTDSGVLSEQQFYFIPGDQEINLSGTEGEGSYTWQEVLKYNPEMVPENLTSYYDSYYHQGITSINRGQVPPPLENYLRAYFQAITPP